MARGKTPKSDDLRAIMAVRLQAARRAYHPRSAEVARRLGVHAHTLNSWEKGRNFPNEFFLIRFCDLTGVPVDWLFKGAAGIEAKMTPELAASLVLRYGGEMRDVMSLDGRSRERTISELRLGMARRLRMARTAFRDDRAAVANLLGIKKKVLDAYEVGRNFPDERILVVFSEIVGCPIDWIFRGLMTSRMSLEMAARIAALSPNLLDGPEGYEEHARRQGAQVSEDA
jgi:transcriptional regulator with XRE-family HTH domain